MVKVFDPEEEKNSYIMVVSFLFIQSMFIIIITSSTISSIYTTIYTILYIQKKKEEREEERRNMTYSHSSILGFLGYGFQGNIVDWGLFHSCSFKVMIEQFESPTEQQVGKLNNTADNIDKRVMSPTIKVMIGISKISAKAWNGMTVEERTATLVSIAEEAVKQDAIIYAPIKRV